jgi:hypothetical protein
MFDENTFYNPSEKQLSLASEIIEIIENPELDHEIEPTAEVEIPFIHQAITLPAIESEPSKQQHAPSGLLTPSTDASLSRYVTPETEPQPQPQPQQRHAQASRDINLEISESNIITGPRQRKPRNQAYHAALEQPQEIPGYHAAFAAGTCLKIDPLIPIPKVMQSQLPPPPKGWKEMLKHPHHLGFRAAAEKEFRSLEQRSTFKPTTRPTGKQVLPLMWVFTYKCDQDGYLVKYKARLCIRGDLQKVTAKDTYAATLAVQVFRSLMAIAAAYNLEAKQLDAVNAFVNSHMDEEVYCECPPGYEHLGACLQVLRALYGLRRSPRLWHDEFVKTLKEFGLQPITGQLCLFTNGSIILFFYVDDIVLLGRDLEAIQDLKKALMSRYEMRDLGDLQWFLGIRIIRDRSERKLWLSQDAYIDKLIAKFNLESHRPTHTPLPSEPLTPNDGQASPQQIYAFQQRVGSITYAAVVTRVDVALAVSMLSRFLQNPSTKHLDAADHCLAYLDTCYYVL